MYDSTTYLVYVQCAPDISQSLFLQITHERYDSMGVFREFGSVTEALLSKLLCSVQYRVML